jgi:hypothetical protein
VQSSTPVQTAGSDHLSGKTHETMPGTGPESWLASKLTPQNIINSGSMYPLQEPGFHGEQKKRACTLMELQDTKKKTVMLTIISQIQQISK